MKLVDTHCHLDFPNYKDDLAEVIRRAEDAGVVRMIIPGTNVAGSRDAVRLAEKYPAIFTACGIHPHEADKVSPEDVAAIRELAVQNDKVVAIGEVGLDYYRGFAEKENQKKLFRDCLRLAKEFDLAVILHNRQADEDFIDIVKEELGPDVKGVAHCFSGDKKLLDELLSLGLYISFTGNITFKKTQELRDLIKYVPQDRLLLETDSPYISPEPLRGQRNEPAHVKHLLDVHAGVYGLTPIDIARITTHNANILFELGLEEKGEITYPIRDSLYINVTNRCTNRCTFCTRQYSDYVKGHNLRLDFEPSEEEIIDALGDLSAYKEVVFCGYGEPTLRLETVRKVASFVKGKGVKVRLTTNGGGDLINSRSIAPELKGLIDVISVSLNAPDAESYDEICKSVYGGKAYDAMLKFIKECRGEGIEVELTCLDMIGEENVEKCRKMALELDSSFRLRKLHVVG